MKKIQGHTDVVKLAIFFFTRFQDHKYIRYSRIISSRDTNKKIQNDTDEV